MNEIQEKLIKEFEELLGDCSKLSIEEIDSIIDEVYEDEEEEH